ncbi:unnamed protein product [Chrysoparadoxa australica]
MGRLVHWTPRTAAQAFENNRRVLWLLQLKHCPPLPRDYLLNASYLMKGIHSIIWGLLWHMSRAYHPHMLPQVECLGGGVVRPITSYTKPQHLALEQSLLGWLSGTLDVLNGFLGDGVLPSSLFVLQDYMKDGTLLCTLVKAVTGKAALGWLHRPRTRSLCEGNIHKAFQVLRQELNMSRRHLTSQDQQSILDGDWHAVYGLLEDMHRFFDKMPPRPIPPLKYEVPYLAASSTATATRGAAAAKVATASYKPPMAPPPLPSPTLEGYGAAGGGGGGGDGGDALPHVPARQSELGFDQVERNPPLYGHATPPPATATNHSWQHSTAPAPLLQWPHIYASVLPAGALPETSSEMSTPVLEATGAASPSFSSFPVPPSVATDLSMSLLDEILLDLPHQCLPAATVLDPFERKSDLTMVPLMVKASALTPQGGQTPYATATASVTPTATAAAPQDETNEPKAARRICRCQHSQTCTEHDQISGVLEFFPCGESCTQTIYSPVYETNRNAAADSRKASKASIALPISQSLALPVPPPHGLIVEDSWKGELDLSESEGPSEKVIQNVEAVGQVSPKVTEEKGPRRREPVTLAASAQAKAETKAEANVPLIHADANLSAKVEVNASPSIIQIKGLETWLRGLKLGHTSSMIDVDGSEWSDGILLCRLCEKLSYGRIKVNGLFESPKKHAHRVQNIRRAMDTFILSFKLPRTICRLEDGILKGEANDVLSLLLLVKQRCGTMRLGPKKTVS